MLGYQARLQLECVFRFDRASRIAVDLLIKIATPSWLDMSDRLREFQ